MYLVGAAVIIRGCHNGDKGTAENERLRDLKFIFSYPKNERLIFLYSRNAAQKEISTMRVGAAKGEGYFPKYTKQFLIWYYDTNEII